MPGDLYMFTTDCMYFLVRLHDVAHSYCTTQSQSKAVILVSVQESGTDASAYASSTIVQTSAPKELGTLRQADGDEGFASKAATVAGNRDAKLVTDVANSSR